MDMAALCASIGAALSRRSGATDSFTGSERPVRSDGPARPRAIGAAHPTRPVGLIPPEALAIRIKGSPGRRAGSTPAILGEAMCRYFARALEDIGWYLLFEQVAGSAGRITRLHELLGDDSGAG